MTRQEYLAEVLRLYLEAPDTPSQPRRRDLTLAGELYRRGVRLDHLAHAIRLATLRRRLGHHPANDTIHSLAYYRTVFEGLTAEELDPGYVDYVHQRHRKLQTAESPSTEPRPHSQDAAPFDRR